MKESNSLLSELAIDWIEDYIIRAGAVLIGEGVNAGREEGVTVFQPTGAQYSAVMDLKVCPFCASLDEMVVDLRSGEGQRIFHQYHPAQHPFCRCIWIYIFEEDFKSDNQRFEKTWIDKFHTDNPDKRDWSQGQISQQYRQFKFPRNQMELPFDVWKDAQKKNDEVIERKKQRIETGFLDSLRLMFKVDKKKKGK